MEQTEATPIHDELWRDTYAPGEPRSDLWRHIWWGIATVLLAVSLLLLAGAA